MRVTRLDPGRRELFDSALFDGGAVHRQALVDDTEDAPAQSPTLRMQLVAFEAGAHTRLHTHTADQVLVVTEGEGYVGTVDDHFLVRQGDVVHVPAGERHYHGAGPTRPMSHLSILTPSELAIVDDGWEWPAGAAHRPVP
jgi:quercetin dioxygenase-like cupin family protein